MREHLGDRPLLDDLARIHHAHPVGDLGNDREIVGDENETHVALRLEGGKQIEDLRLDGDVERRGRLVGDQEPRPVGDRGGDHGALALAARELMRIGARALLRIGQADVLQQGDRLRARPPRATHRDARGSPRPPDRRRDAPD